MAAEANEGNVNSLFFLGCYLIFLISDRTINLKQTINIEILILVECGSHGRHMRDEEINFVGTAGWEIKR